MAKRRKVQSAPKQEDLTPIEQVKEWKLDVLTCRDLGHAWEVSKYTTLQGNKIIERARHCLRPCGTTKIEWLFRSGEKVKDPRYSYAPGYLTHGVRGRVSRTVVRREVLDRAVRLIRSRARGGRAVARRAS